MADQIQDFPQLPYINFEATRLRKSVKDGFSSLRKHATLSPAAWKTLGIVAWILVFSWQIIGLVLYAIRAFETSINAKHASFQSTHIELYSNSEALELTWLVTLLFNNALVMLAVSKVPSFVGYFVILKKLVRLPSFWSLLALTAVSMSGYVIIMAFKYDSAMELALIVAFMVERLVQVILVSFINFTQVHHAWNTGSRIVFVFIKTNITFSFVNYFIQFVVGSVQFTLDVYGIDSEIETESDLFHIFGAIRRFAVVVFCYRIFKFYWEKLFIDNRNILCHYDFLENRHGTQENLPQLNIQ